jgi:hypothetical protein
MNQYTIRAVSNFFENSRRYSQLKVDHLYQQHRWQTCHRYQRHLRQILPPVSVVLLISVANLPRCRRHRWQTMRLISGWGYFKVNWKANNYIYVNSTIQRCPNKIIKIFLIEDFFHLPPVSATQVVNLELWISPWILEKIWNGPNGILWGWGETDSWKEPEAKNLVTLSLRDSVTRFFRKFTEIFASQGAPPVSTTPVANLPPVLMSPVANCHRYQLHQWHICHRYQWHCTVSSAGNLCWQIRISTCTVTILESVVPLF